MIEGHSWEVVSQEEEYMQEQRLFYQTTKAYYTVPLFLIALIRMLWQKDLQYQVQIVFL